MERYVERETTLPRSVPVQKQTPSSETNMTVKNWPASSDDGGGCGMKCRKPFEPKTMKTNASKYRAMVEAIFIAFPFWSEFLK